MANSRSPASGRLTRSLLNDLIIACNDGARAQLAASRIVSGTERRQRLAAGAGRRLTFAADIGALVRKLGHVPAHGGSLVEAIRAAAHSIRVLVVGENGGDTYGSCARIEAKAEKLYERAARANLAAPTASILELHLAEIASDRAELRRFSMGG